MSPICSLSLFLRSEIPASTSSIDSIPVWTLGVPLLLFQRYVEDEMNCNKFFTEILEVRNVKIEKVIRIRKRIQKRDRPLLVKIGSEEGKVQILRNSQVS